MRTPRSEQLTLLAFLGIVVLGGVNGTAIRIGDVELGPFWYATLRFGIAALILFAIVVLRRVPLPRGRALLGSTLYGLLSFGVSFALINWALVTVPAGLAQVVLALVPLLTFLLAVAQGLERFRLQSVAGSILALLGVVLVFAERIGANVPPLPLIAVVFAALSIAESNIVVKRFPRANAVSHNAVAMAVGALLLLALTLVSAEPLTVPTRIETVLALGYLAVVGSVIVFSLYLFVIARWTASATSYAMLLMPLVSVVVAAILLHEAITIELVAGGVLVLAGVYLGAFAPSLRRPLPGLVRMPRAPFGRGTRPSGPPELEAPCP